MTVYYIKHEEYDDRAKVIHGLRNIYNLQTYQLTAVIVEDEQLEDVLGPIFGSLAEHIEKPLAYIKAEDDSKWMVEPESGDTSTTTVTDALVAEFIPAAEPVKEKKTRKQIPQELCPRCGKMAQMTKKGYCKLCAMKMAKEARPSTKAEQPASAQPVVREREAQGVEIVFETTPVEMRQLKRHGAIRGKKLG
jgi:NMD protein affecting ribosome stability and mRNA decay